MRLIPKNISGSSLVKIIGKPLENLSKRELKLIGKNRPNILLLINKERSLVRKPITIADRLGLTKGERNNLGRTQKEALQDLEQYINSGQYRLLPSLENGKIVWKDEGSIPDVVLYDGATIQKLGQSLNVSAEYPNGTASLTSFNNGEGKIILTPAKVELQAHRDAVLRAKAAPDLPWNKKMAEEIPMSETELLTMPDLIPSDVMKKFWTAVYDSRRPGTYFSGDLGDAPMGERLIRIFKDTLKSPYSMSYPTHFDPAVGDVVRIPNSTPVPTRTRSLNDITEALREEKWATVGGNIEGLSPDSYMALLKQGNRPGYSLRFSVSDPMIGWNNTAVKHKNIYEAFEKAQKGELSLLEFILMFNEWVKPYGGIPARIIKDYKGKSIIGIPHPFVYKNKKGGKL